jgi:hypothetical protein
MLPVRFALAMLISLWLVGCGDATSLEVDSRSLQFQAVEGEALPNAQTIKARFKGAAVIVGLPPGVSKPSWLDITHASSDESSASFRFSVNTTSMPAGTYDVTVRFVTGTQEGKELKSLDVPISYILQPAPRPLTLAPSRLEFTARSGQAAPPTAASVSVTADPAQPVSFTLSAVYSGSARDWLSFPASGTTPQTLEIRPKTAALSPGLYSATVLVTPSNGKPAIQIPVSYSISQSPFFISPARLDFRAVHGQGTFPAAQSVSVSSEQGMAVSYAVTAAYTGGAQDWLTLPPSGFTPQSLSLQPNTTALPAGIYDALLTFTPSNNLPPVQLAVTYVVTAPGLTHSPAQLSFTALSGQSAPPAAQSVSLTGEQGMAVGYSVTASYTGAAQGWLTLPPSGTTPQSLTLQPNTAALPAGQYSAIVRFTPNNGQAASQLTVTYSLSAPAITVSPTQLSFTAHSGQSAPPAAQSVSLTGEQGTAVGYSVTATYAGGAQDWLTLPPSGTTPRSVSLQPNTAALAPGQYSAVVRFTPNNGRPAAQVTVTYSVLASELRVNPSAPTLLVNASTTESQLTFPLTVASTGAPLAWRVVSISAPWLDNTLVSGNTQTDPGMNLVVLKSALTGMNNGTYPGTITLAYSAGSTAERQLVVNVRLDLSLPRVRSVAPYAIEAGRSDSHILRGEGFAGLQSSQGLRFGATTVSNFQVISDTEIRLTVPALPVGAHTVLADNALGLSRSGATLHAVQTPAFAEASLPRGNRWPRRTLYDPLRTAIYTVDNNFDTGAAMGLYRSRYVNGTWEEAPYVYLPNIYDAAMDIDGQSLYLSVGSGLYRLDLNDASATPQFIQAIPQYSQLEVLNDGHLLIGGDCTYMVTSLDGRQTMLVPRGCTSGSYPIRIFEASTRQYRDTPVRTSVSFWTNLAFERTARYAVVSDSIYDAQWNLISGLTTPLYGMAFTPDGRRLYGFYGSSSSQLRLQVYDVSTPPVGGQFPRLHDALVTGGQSGDMYLAGVFITPNGRTLIMVSKSRLYVWPIPGNLQ